MGTRCDFYVGRGEQAEWLGSYPFDGKPHGTFCDDKQILNSPTQETWRAWVADYLAREADRSTTPDMGWPWPWADSRTTDYAYAWDEGVIYGSSFGHAWFRVDAEADNWGEDEDEDSDKTAVFPDMTDQKVVTFGRRSGLIVLGGM